MQFSGRAPEACNGCWLICMLNVAVVIINLIHENISVCQTTALEVALPPEMCFHQGRWCRKRHPIKLLEETTCPVQLMEDMLCHKISQLSHLVAEHRQMCSAPVSQAILTLMGVFSYRPPYRANAGDRDEVDSRRKAVRRWYLPTRDSQQPHKCTYHGTPSQDQ